MIGIAAARGWLAQRSRGREARLVVRTGQCANCAAAVSGAYCAQCGQETAIELPTARAFLREAAGRYVTLDGRLWRTLVALALRPGFLTREYLAGRRRRYVRPGRLFLVLSLLLFAVLRLDIDVPGTVVLQGDDVPRATSSPEGPASGPAGPASHLSLGVDKDLNLTLDSSSPWLGPVRKRLESFNRLDRAQKGEQLIGGMLRYGPYALVALLPVFAALMQIAFVGRAARYPQRPRRYAAHLVYAAHIHAFVALATMLFTVVPFGFLRAAIQVWSLVYVLRSTRAVYGGPWLSVVIRALFVGLSYLVCFSFACVALFFAAVTLR